MTTSLQVLRLEPSGKNHFESLPLKCKALGELYRNLNDPPTLTVKGDRRTVTWNVWPSRGLLFGVNQMPQEVLCVLEGDSMWLQKGTRGIRYSVVQPMEIDQNEKVKKVKVTIKGLPFFFWLPLPNPVPLRHSFG